MKVRFLGGAETVTGSRFLIESNGYRLLVDCGLFQGMKHLRRRNWKPLAVSPSEIDSVVLTHAHIDHSGYIPRLIQKGFRGDVHCTAATEELCRILLPDCGYIQEEDARYANKMGYSKHEKALPLYTESEGRSSLRRFKKHGFGEEFELGPARVELRPAGHILGASSALIKIEEKKIVFSGDLGRYSDFFMHGPSQLPACDVLIMESTYGDRIHKKFDVVELLAGLVRKVRERNSVLLIPAFAVARSQAILFALNQVFESEPELKTPVYLNSPMATDVTELYQEHHGFHKLSSEECEKVFRLAQFVYSPEESKRLNTLKGPAIIISSSGMLTGGRVVHHMKSLAPDDRNIILLPGYQAPGTRGAALAGGARTIKIHGEHIPVRAEVHQIDVLSAHADQNELVRWVREAETPPKKVFLVHGDPASADALRFRIQDELSLDVEVAENGEVISFL